MLAKLPPERAALLAAADLIEEYGHARSSFGCLGEPMCCLGAISAATGGPWLGRDFLLLHLGVDSIANWNDAPGRTKDEVVDALRAAARRGL